jgi:pimeloyl-ACP methyl ester carboxylesterase
MHASSARPGARERRVKHWRTLLSLVGIAFLILGASWVRRSQLPREEFTIDTGGCRTPVTLINPAADVTPAGSVVLLHGLSANRKLMMYLAEDFAGHGFRAYALDLPGHGDSTDAFSFARAQFCATLAVDWLTREGKIDPATTTLVGHSMGGAIAIRMADVEPVAATIAISPAPMIAPSRMPSNLLVFSASADIAPLKREAGALSAAADGNRIAPDDFLQKRAFELQSLPHSTHTSLITDRRVAHRSEQWMMQTVFPNISFNTLTLNLDLGTYESYGKGRRRLAGSILGQIGIILIFPILAAVAGRLSGGATIESAGAKPTPWLVLIEVVVASLIGILFLNFAVPLRFLHMYSADYLVSLLAIVGAVLLFLNFGFAMEYAWLKPAKLFAAAVLGFAAILAMGGWMNWQLDDAWMNAPRWARFIGILPFAYLYAFAEEVVLGPVKHGWARAARFTLFGALRIEIFLALLVGYYVLGNGEILLILLLVFFIAFSIVQRLAADAVRSHSGSATAAAFFGAILAAWFVATVFPLT